MKALLRACGVAAGVLVLAASLTACETDSRPCIRSHTELMTTVVPGANGTSTVLVVPYDVCDEYAPEPTSTGDK